MNTTSESPSRTAPPLLVLITGSYMSGTGGDPERVAENRRQLEKHTLPIYLRGHLPIVSEWTALPMIEAAAEATSAKDAFEKYQYAVARLMIERCDAVLRTPVESRGADLDVARAHELGLKVYYDVSELPDRRGYI